MLAKLFNMSYNYLSFDSTVKAIRMEPTVID